MGKSPESITPGQMSYHLRRLRLHGLIERVRGSHRYLVTESGWRSILFCTRVCNRVLRPGLAEVMAEKTESASKLRREFDRLDEAIGEMLEANGLSHET
jgi:DNA-binding MarR family transcriptional regulator